jgi:hypothetical protein
MNIDNQLLLGLVFITAGIALALLAYAVLLNRRSSADDETPDESEAVDLEGPSEAEEPVPTQIAPEPKPATPGFEAPTMLIREPSPPPAEEAEAPADEAEPPVVDTEGEPETPEAAPATILAQPEEVDEPEAPAVSLQRAAGTGKLVIRVGDKSFSSMRELKNTELWGQVGGLFEELHAWMAVVPPQAPIAPSREPKAASGEPTKKAPSAVSMVDEINEILAEKLDSSDTAPQGVHIAEGADGSIRVFIGVQGYAMDQVPNDEVRRLIRESVSEWEARP